jgi:class 3 adenylate cyclase/pimeloyl-ACP methyl ester carboxylesterase
VERPETRYVAVGEADVAYQILGDSPLDLLSCWGLGSHIEHWWEDTPAWEAFSRVATFTRLIVFDRRGTGASDGIPRSTSPTWEEWAEDFGAVLHAAGSKEAAILATLDAGPIAILFAAMHPERVKALVLQNTGARFLRADDYPIGLAPEAIDLLLDLVATKWGSTELQELTAPDVVEDRATLESFARMQRASATPRTAAAQYRYILRDLDVRSALPLIDAPTLVLHSRDNPLVPVALGRYLAENIKGAAFIELPTAAIAGLDLSAELSEFLTGQVLEVEIDRVLTTVLFTDIVGSTERAAELGDNRWRSVLDTHDRAARRELQRFGGREINTTGDGFVANFDGPARAIRCAKAIREAVHGLGLDIRSGIHTGECEVRGADLAGLAVHIAARVAAIAEPGEVLVSGMVKDLVIGSGIDFDDRGEHELKGVPGSWKLFVVRG